MKADEAPRLVFVCAEGVQPAVLEAQVFQLLEQLQKKGWTYDLLLLGNLRTGFLSHQTNLAKLSELRRRLSGIIQFIYLPSFGFFSILYARLRIFFWLVGDLLKKRVILLHCRNDYSAFICSFLPKWFGNVHLLYDMRGEKLSEYDYRCGCRKNIWQRWKRRKFAYWQRVITSCADVCTCVSHPLAEYLRVKHQLANRKVMVLRTGSDESRYFFDMERRSVLRTKLGIERKSVWIYCGSLESYQMVDSMLEFFSWIHVRDSNAFLLFLCPEPGSIKNRLNQLGLQNDSLVVSVPNREVPDYLMAADVGLLFREDLPINHYASPTKLGEYWLCGLPILTTAGNLDGSQQIEKYPELGVLIDLASRDTWMETYERISNLQKSFGIREKIRTIALKEYSRQTYLERYQELVRSILSMGE